MITRTWAHDYRTEAGDYICAFRSHHLIRFRGCMGLRLHGGTRLGTFIYMGERVLEAKRVPKTSPRGFKRVPRGLRMAPRGFQDVSRRVHESSKMAQDGSKTSSRGSKSVSRGFKTGPRGLRTAPRWFQEASRWLPNLSGRFKDAFNIEKPRENHENRT